MNSADRRVIEQECRDLVCALVHHSDRNEGTQVAELFAVDAHWNRGGKPLVGRQAILQSYQGSGARSPTETIRHFATATRVIVEDEAHANAVTYYLVYRFDPGVVGFPLPLPLEQPFSAGEWHDQFVLTGAGWRFSGRRTHRLFKRVDGNT